MAKYVYGIDIGGTTVKMGLFNDAGEMLDKWEIPTRKEDGGDHILDDIAASIVAKNEEKGINPDDILGAGMGVPGPVTSDGRVLNCVNLGWGIFNVANKFSAVSNIAKVRVGNDANVAALGEQWKGGGRGFGSIVMVTLGTGVGGGIIMDNHIVAGSNGAAGEIGHITMNPEETRKCNCGKAGCLEQYASATGITRMSKEKLESTDTPSELRQYDIPITGKELFAAYKNDDALAKEIVETFSTYLGRGLAHVAQVIDPEAFVIGGGVSKNGQIVIDVIQEKYEDYVMFALKNKEFRLAELGNDAGMYGACR
nr:ROK family glucokinase [Lachnospiraceae bacterium]